MVEEVYWEGWIGDGYTDTILESMEKTLNSYIEDIEELKVGEIPASMNVERRKRICHQAEKLKEITEEIERKYR